MVRGVNAQVGIKQEPQLLYVEVHAISLQADSVYALKVSYGMTLMEMVLHGTTHRNLGQQKVWEVHVLHKFILIFILEYLEKQETKLELGHAVFNPQPTTLLQWAFLRIHRTGTLNLKVLSQV